MRNAAGHINRWKALTRTAAKDQLLCELEQQRTISEAEIEWLRKTRQELEDSRNRLIALYDHSPVAYVTLDPRGNIQGSNETASRLLGYPQSKLLHLPFTFLVSPSDANHFLNYLDRCRQSGESKMVVELKLRTKGKKLIPVQLVCVCFEQAGKYLFQTALVDLTERKQNERALEQAKSFAESIVETVHEPLVVLDSEFKIVSVNRAFTEVFKKSVTAVKGQFLEIVFNLWWSGNPLRQEFEKVLLHNLVLENCELDIEPRHLGKRTLLINARRLSEKENLPPLILVAVEDITVRKQTQEQLRRTNEELEKRVELRTRALQESHGQMQSFCYSIAHDLRAPLRAIQGLTNAMVDDHLPGLDPQGKDYADRIVAAAQRMDQLINDLLEYGRLTTTELAIGEVDTDKVFEKVRAIFKDELRDKKAVISKEGSLPCVRGHALIIEVAFINLISNALKFVSPGVKPQIGIWSEENDGVARIYFEDNGIGIAPEYKTRIFNVFERLHSDQAYPGTGIGLAIVKKGIERLGGRVGLDSKPNRGTTFWIELPSSAKLDEPTGSGEVWAKTQTT